MSRMTNKQRRDCALNVYKGVLDFVDSAVLKHLAADDPLPEDEQKDFDDDCESILNAVRDLIETEIDA